MNGIHVRIFFFSECSRLSERLRLQHASWRPRVIRCLQESVHVTDSPNSATCKLLLSEARRHPVDRAVYGHVIALSNFAHPPSTLPSTNSRNPRFERYRNRFALVCTEPVLWSSGIQAPGGLTVPGTARLLWLPVRCLVQVQCTRAHSQGATSRWHLGEICAHLAKDGHKSVDVAALSAVLKRTCSALNGALAATLLHDLLHLLASNPIRISTSSSSASSASDSSPLLLSESQ